MTRKQSERRAHPRIKASFALEVTRQGAVLVASAENLSRSGIMCTLPEEVQPMTRVKISLCLPPTGPGPREGTREIRTEGVIVRCDPVGPKGRFETAIFFPALGEEEALSIDRFVKGRQARQTI
ncbi:MAG: PilZ domain-containing protein [Candidatus Omnitrophica bacterium]|nr:PilZ domain-containing protein [Candidatus Omnitrophota bacterium]